MFELLHSITSLSALLKKWNENRLLKKFAFSLTAVENQLTNASRFISFAVLRSREERDRLIVHRLDTDALISKLITPPGFVGAAQRGAEALDQANSSFDIIFADNQHLFELAPQEQLLEFLQHYKRSEFLTQLSVETSITRMQIVQKVTSELLDRANAQSQTEADSSVANLDLNDLPAVEEVQPGQQVVLTLLNERRTRIEEILKFLESNSNEDLSGVVESPEDSAKALRMLRLNGFTNSDRILNYCARGVSLLIFRSHSQADQSLLIGPLGKLIELEMNNMLSLQIRLINHAVRACEKKISVCKTRIQLIEKISARLAAK